MRKVFTPYILLYALLFVLMLALLCGYPKAELHLMLNACHTECLDTFMKYYSVLAEWPLYIIALLPLAFKRWRWTMWYACCELSSAGIIQIIKHIFKAPRPATYFEDFPNLVLPVVDGVHLHHSNSFPSGHTATFFVFFTFCALLLSAYYARNNKPLLKGNLMVMIMLLAAALGGYSRIYLSQHFLSDICVGSLIGVITTCVVFKLSNKASSKYRIDL